MALRWQVKGEASVAMPFLGPGLVRSPIPPRCLSRRATWLPRSSGASASTPAPRSATRRAGPTGLLRVSRLPAFSGPDTTQFLLDSRGRLLQQVQPDGATTTNVLDAEGQVDVAVDPLGHPTLYSYVYGASNSTLGGGDGDLVQVTYADGTTETGRERAGSG